jgi:hypothetical protein
VWEGHEFTRAPDSLYYHALQRLRVGATVLSRQLGLLRRIGAEPNSALLAARLSRALPKIAGSGAL